MTTLESLQLLISTRLDALLAQRAVSEGQAKADIVCAALEAYLAPQTPVERSLQTLERTVKDRFDRLEKLVRQARQDLGTRDLGGHDLGTRDGQRSVSGIAVSEVPPAFEDEDEPDEILPEFLEFASPALQHHVDSLS